MSEYTKELIVIERHKDANDFLLKTVQRERKRPKKYTHQISMPIYLYEELHNKGVIQPESYYIEEYACLECTEIEATRSFIYLYHAEDLHRRIDHYLVVKFAGSYPITRTGVSKL